MNFQTEVRRARRCIYIYKYIFQISSRINLCEFCKWNIWHRSLYVNDRKKLNIITHYLLWNPLCERNRASFKPGGNPVEVNLDTSQMNLALDCPRQGQWWSLANWAWHMWIQVRTLYSSSPTAVNKSCIHCNYVCLLAELWIKLRIRQWTSAPLKPMSWLKSPSEVSGNVSRGKDGLLSTNLGANALILRGFYAFLMEYTSWWTVVSCILLEK